MNKQQFNLIESTTKSGKTCLVFVGEKKCETFKELMRGALLANGYAWSGYFPELEKRGIGFMGIDRETITSLLRAQTWSAWPEKKGKAKATKPAKEATATKVTQAPNSTPAIDIQAMIAKGIEEGVKAALAAQTKPKRMVTKEA